MKSRTSYDTHNDQSVIPQFDTAPNLPSQYTCLKITAISSVLSDTRPYFLSFESTAHACLLASTLACVDIVRNGSAVDKGESRPDAGANVNDFLLNPLFHDALDSFDYVPLGIRARRSTKTDYVALARGV